MDIEKIPTIKKYFKRIYSILPEEIRKKLVSLKLSKENFDQIKKELAFLPKEKQKDYLEELDMLYKKFIKE